MNSVKCYINVSKKVNWGSDVKVFVYKSKRKKDQDTKTKG